MTVKSTNKKELASNALYFIVSMYDDVDQLNGALEDLLQELDKESVEYQKLHEFYMRLTTWNEMDDIKEILKNIGE